MAQVSKAEAERTLLKPPATWTAYDFFMRASDIYSSQWRSSYNAADVYEARQLLERSISLDPSYARANATLSHTHLLAWLFRLDDDYLSPAALERASARLEGDSARPQSADRSCPPRNGADLRGPA
jgi:adenylate cyclase